LTAITIVTFVRSSENCSSTRPTSASSQAGLAERHVLEQLLLGQRRRALEADLGHGHLRSLTDREGDALAVAHVLHRRVHLGEVMTFELQHPEQLADIVLQPEVGQRAALDRLEDLDDVGVRDALDAEHDDLDDERVLGDEEAQSDALQRLILFQLDGVEEPVQRVDVFLQQRAVERLADLRAQRKPQRLLVVALVAGELDCLDVEAVLSQRACRQTRHQSE
jgi:hypothetical protein